MRSRGHPPGDGRLPSAPSGLTGGASREGAAPSTIKAWECGWRSPRPGRSRCEPDLSVAARRRQRGGRRRGCRDRRDVLRAGHRQPARGGAFVSIWPADGEPEVVDGNVEMPGRGLPAERFGAGVREVVDRLRRRGRHVRRAGAVATPGAVPRSRRRCAGTAACRGRRWSSRPPRRAGLATRSARPPRPTSASPADRCSGWTMRRTRSSPHPTARRWQPGQLAHNVPLADVLDLLAVRGGGAVHDRRGGAGVCGGYERARRAGHRRRPRGVRAGGPRAGARGSSASGTSRSNPPPSVGGPMLAVMLGELRAGDATGLGPTSSTSSARCCAYRHAVHDFSVDLEVDGHDAARLGRPARAGRTAQLIEHRARLGRGRQRRHGVRDDDEQRLPGGHRRAGDRVAAQQRAR